MRDIVHAPGPEDKEQGQGEELLPSAHASLSQMAVLRGETCPCVGTWEFRKYQLHCPGMQSRHFHLECYFGSHYKSTEDLAVGCYAGFSQEPPSVT